MDPRASIMTFIIVMSLISSISARSLISITYRKKD